MQKYRYEADSDTFIQRVEPETKRAATEVIEVNGRDRRLPSASARFPGTAEMKRMREHGKVPSRGRYVEGMRSVGALTWTGVYDNLHILTHGGKKQAPDPTFYLERRLTATNPDGTAMWITDHAHGVTRIDPETGELRGLTLSRAQSIARRNPEYSRVVVQTPSGAYLPEAYAKQQAESAARAAARPKGKGSKGLW